MISIVSESYAQRFGVKTGLNLSNMLVKDDNYTWSDNYKMQVGFNIGATVQFPKAGPIAFESGLSFSTKGYRINYDMISGGQEGQVKEKLMLYYLDIPLLFKKSFYIGDVSIFAKLGPYFGLGLYGKYTAKENSQFGTFPSSSEIEWGEYKDLDRIDWGTTFAVGIMIFQSICMEISYDLGIANISTSSNSDDVIKNRVLKISLGYRFWGKE